MADNDFFGMFKDFGKNLNLPGPEINDVIDYHRKNIQALQDAAQASAAGAQDMMARQREALEGTLSDIAKMVESAGGGGAEQGKILSDQADLAKKSFEATVKNATAMGEIARDSGARSFEILKARVEESIEELQNAAKKG